MKDINAPPLRFLPLTIREGQVVESVRENIHVYIQADFCERNVCMLGIRSDKVHIINISLELSHRGSSNVIASIEYSQTIPRGEFVLIPFAFEKDFREGATNPETRHGVVDPFVSLAGTPCPIVVSKCLAFMK